MENKYANGKIYAVRNLYDDEVYIGSTIKTIDRRLQEHIVDAFHRTGNNCRLYQHIRELNPISFYIELVANCPCESKQQLRRHEGEYIRLYGTLNTVIAGRTIKEWYEENKEHHSQICKAWEERNKEHRSQQHKIYEEKNKERRAEQHKIWYQNNKEHLSEKIQCNICGLQIRRSCLLLHQRTKKCHKITINS